MSPRERIYSGSSTGSTGSSSSEVGTTGSEQPTKKRLSVSFGAIQVREYNRILGDNTNVKVGPPISIGWDYVQNEPVDLVKYEESRPFARSRDHLKLVSFERRKILKEFQVPEKEIKATVKMIKKQREREQSKKQEEKERQWNETKKKGKILRRDSLGRVEPEPALPTSPCKQKAQSVFVDPRVSIPGRVRQFISSGCA